MHGASAGDPFPAGAAGRRARPSRKKIAEATIRVSDGTRLFRGGARPPCRVFARSAAGDRERCMPQGTKQQKVHAAASGALWWRAAPDRRKWDARPRSTPGARGRIAHAPVGRDSASRPQRTNRSPRGRWTARRHGPEEEEGRGCYRPSSAWAALVAVVRLLVGAPHSRPAAGTNPALSRGPAATSRSGRCRPRRLLRTTAGVGDADRSVRGTSATTADHGLSAGGGGPAAHPHRRCRRRRQ